MLTPLETTQPELFLLAPRHAGVRQGERRRTLLKRRADLLELVGPSEADMPEELRLTSIRRLPLPHYSIAQQGVWALPPELALHATVEDIHEASHLTRALHAVGQILH